MKRRRFLVGSVSSVLTGATVIGEKPALGVSFDVYQPKNIDAQNVDTILISLENFNITPHYLDDSRDIKITVEATAENGNPD